MVLGWWTSILLVPGPKIIQVTSMDPLNYLKRNLADELLLLFIFNVSLFTYKVMLSLIVDFHSGDMLSAGRTVEPPRRLLRLWGLHVPLHPAGQLASSNGLCTKEML